MATPTLVDLTKAVLENYLNEMHTAIPARVVEYSHSRQEAVVQPVIKKRYYDAGGAEDGLEDMPPIVAVPVVFPAAASGTLTFPIKKGDLVLLVFSERSIDKFNVSDGKTMIDPEDYRKFSYNDAIAIPGIFPQSPSLASHPEDVVLKFRTQTGKSSISFSPDGTIAIDCSNLLVTTGGFSVQSNQTNIRSENSLVLESQNRMDIVANDRLEIEANELYDFSADRRTSTLYKQTEVLNEGSYVVSVDGKFSLSSEDDLAVSGATKLSIQSGQDMALSAGGKFTTASTGQTAMNATAGLSVNSSGITAIDGSTINIGMGGTSGSEAPLTPEDPQEIPTLPDGFICSNKKLVFKQAKGKIVDNSKFVLLDATNRQGATAFVFVKPITPPIDWLTLNEGGNGKVGDSLTVQADNQYFVHVKINEFANSLQIGKYTCGIYFNKANNPDADFWDFCDVELEIVD